ncbi:Ferredoxin--NADP reductase 1 [Bienertia sinuspersici]
MARNSRSKSGRKQKAQKQKPKTSKHGIAREVYENNEDDIIECPHANPNECERVTPEQAMEQSRGHTRVELNLSDWLHSVKGKHPISRISRGEDCANEGTPVLQPQNIEDKESKEDITQITQGDIKPEIDYWQSSIVGYVIGANPPGNVMEGFLRCIWKKFDIDKVVTIKKGMFLVRFCSIEKRDQVLSMECPFFDSKPMIIKPWTEDMDLTKEDVKTVPIWIQLSVDFRYWGMSCLEKILKPVGTLLNVENTTAKRERLSFARCRVEVSLNQEFPNMVTFNNEKYELTRGYIKYEWKPTVCKQCKKLGHLEEECYFKKSDAKPQQKQQQQWVAKQAARDQTKEGDGENNIVDTTTAKDSGFTLVISKRNRWKQGDYQGQNENSEQITQAGNEDGSQPNADDEGDGKGHEIGRGDSPRSCMEDCGMQDIPYGGHFFTWSNNQNDEDRVFSKLDRVMANERWLEAYGGANALFLSEGVSDHCPAIMQVDKSIGTGKKPFKYYRIWSQAVDFKDRVKQAWKGTTNGTPMFKLTQLLKKVKASLKRLNQEGFCSMQADETRAYQHLLKI